MNLQTQSEISTVFTNLASKLLYLESMVNNNLLFI